MTEAQVGFLYNIAAAVSGSGNVRENTILKSYYLMRCKNITRGYGLPDKYFSSKIRCPNCCIEWKPNTDIKTRSIKLSNRQRKRLKSHKVKESKKEYVRNRKDLLHSNEVEQICTFCKLSTVTPSPKPQKEDIKPITTGLDYNHKKHENENQKRNEIPTVVNLQILDEKNTKVFKKKGINVYANALDVFSLQNKNNTLVTKEKPKVINNNKRKKETKLKGKEEKQTKLSLFLKPSL